MSRNSNNKKVRHSSLEMPDVDVVKRKYDMLTRARNKFFNFGDFRNKNSDMPESPTNKKGRQSTIESLFKATHHPIETFVENTSSDQLSKLKKQNSVTSYPIQIQVEDYNDCTISRNRPATICVDKIEQNLDTAALALERPRKKLSFLEPEQTSCKGSKTSDRGVRCRKADTNTLMLPVPGGGMKRSISFTNGMVRTPSVDDFDLESQAMRVVRTVGQAFEVCHKLSITAPDNENLDHEEQETLTQDLPSDVVSDITSDKGRKEFQCDIEMERISLPSCDDNTFRESQEHKISSATMPRHFDLLPPPSSKKHSMTSGETYASPQNDVITRECNAPPNSLQLPGGTLSTHHEIQLLREQFEQQIQQTQAALAQLQLAREQLASEQAARIEAQSRTHQLLVHNRELLDHIAALVSHLQNGSEKSGAVGGHQQNSTHLTLPQHQPSENYMADLTDAALDNSIHHALGFNSPGFIENMAATSCLPSSPLKPYNPTGNMFNFPYSPEANIENQLLHRLQALSSYTPQSPYPFSYNPTPPFFQSPFFSPPNLLSSNINLSHSRQQYPPSPISTRHSFTENQIHGTRHSSEPRQIPYQYSNSMSHASSRPLSSIHLQNYSQKLQNDVIEQQKTLHSQLNQQSTYLHNNKPNSQSSLSSHNPTSTAESTRSSSQHGVTLKANSLIKPLSQMGTLTTTDSGGKVRVIVPVPSNASNSIKNNNIETEGLLANLKLTDDFRMNGPPIQRSTSEKVPNRSDLMSQVQRSMWARHTTK